jgi:hypothetical protein
MFESPVRIENRAKLIYTLSEASELEHGLSCCYLFAVLSLKTSTDEGVSKEQVQGHKTVETGDQRNGGRIARFRLACLRLTFLNSRPSGSGNED